MLSHEIEYGKRAWFTIYNACKEGGIMELANDIESEIKNKSATFVLSNPDYYL